MKARALRALAVCAAAWCLCGPARADEPGFFEVRVRLRVDPSIRSTAILHMLKDETESLWKPYGVHLEWVDARPGDGAAEGFFMEAVIDRRGDGQAQPEHAVLGRAWVPQDATGERPIHVSFDATEQMLLRRPSSIPVVGEYDMGRALGRVLAHEIGHVLLEVRHHDRAGLMRAVFAPAELGSPDRTPFRLTCDGVGRLRSRIQVLSGSRGAGCEVRAARHGVRGAACEVPERTPCPLTAVR
jgi:hypothetical protein